MTIIIAITDSRRISKIQDVDEAPEMMKFILFYQDDLLNLVNERDFSGVIT
jgi:hypothetical protein